MAPVTAQDPRDASLLADSAGLHAHNSVTCLASQPVCNEKCQVAREQSHSFDERHFEDAAARAGTLLFESSVHLE